MVRGRGFARVSIFLFFLVLFQVPWSPAGTQTVPDPRLAAMEAELNRNFQGLSEKGDPKPYFMSYHLTDSERLDLSGSYGAIKTDDFSRYQLVDVEVRVGDYTFDNYHRIKGDRFGMSRDYSRPVSAPLDDDPASLRAALWLETDRRYKAAVERYIQVKTNQAVRVKEEDASDDFSREEPVRYFGAPARLNVDREIWKKRVRELSRLFTASPLIFESRVELTASAETKYYLNTEKTAVLEGLSRYRVALYAATRAEDGMELFRYENFDAHSAEGLPDEATLRRTAEKMVKDLIALRSAPVIEPYTGPAILSGRAAGVFFHEIFGHRIEGHRQKDEEEGQTFTKKVGQPVLPDFLSVFDDPTLEKAGKSDLNGTFKFDNEGIPAQRVTVVDKGILRNFLMSRSPVAGFNRSNGHGRKSPGSRAVGRQGNLIVESSKVVTPERLREMLIEECKKQDKPFGLIFADISGGFTFTGRGMPQSFQVTPIMVYRVFTDGRPDELVRGVDLIGTPLASFSKIVAADDTPGVFNGYCGAESGWVPVSAVSPSLLTQEIEIQKKEKSSDRPPLLPPPGRDEEDRR